LRQSSHRRYLCHPVSPGSAEKSHALTAQNTSSVCVRWQTEHCTVMRALASGVASHDATMPSTFPGSVGRGPGWSVHVFIGRSFREGGRGRSPAQGGSERLEPGAVDADRAPGGFELLGVREGHGEGASVPVVRAGLAVLVVADPELEGVLGGVAVPAVHVVSSCSGLLYGSSVQGVDGAVKSSLEVLLLGCVLRFSVGVGGVCDHEQKVLAARRVLDDGGRLALIPRFRLRLTHPLGLGAGGPLLGGELLDSALSPHGVPAVTLGFGLLSAALGLPPHSLVVHAGRLLGLLLDQRRSHAAVHVVAVVPPAPATGHVRAVVTAREGAS